MGEVLRLVDIWKVFKQGSEKYAVLKGVNLTVTAGEMLVVMGPSGSGKTTLLTIAGTLDKPSRGRVYVGGIDATGLSEEELAEFRSMRIGFVFQSYNLIGNFTALENVMFPMLLTKRYSAEEARERARELLELVDMGPHADKFPCQLSGGQQQRVAIARALANDPDVVLMDEPTGNLDVVSAARVASLVKWLNEVYGQTFVIVTHNPELASIASRVVYMRDGVLYDYDRPPTRMLEAGIAEEIKRARERRGLKLSQLRLLRLRAENARKLAAQGKLSPDKVSKEVELLRVKLERIKSLA